MRELNRVEMTVAQGGIGLVGAVIGGAVGGGAALANNQSIGRVAVATFLGALGGFTGGLASAAATGGFFVRLGWGMRSAGLSFAAGEVGATESK